MEFLQKEQKENNMQEKNLNLEKLKIGEVYEFVYDKPDYQKNLSGNEKIQVKLKAEIASKLIKELTDFSAELTEALKERIREIKDLHKTEKLLEHLQQNRIEKYGKKSDPSEAEELLTELTNSLTSKLFKKQKKNENQKNCELFIRNYNIDNMYTYIPELNPKRDPIVAVFAGKIITRYGHLVFSWYTLSPVWIDKKLFNEKYMEKI